MYPIMLQHLFVRIGFAWTVRISGFLGLALCLAAIGLVSSRLPPKSRLDSWFEVKTLKDTPFILVVIGSFFISLGTHYPRHRSGKANVALVKDYSFRSSTSLTTQWRSPSSPQRRSMCSLS